MDDLDTFLNSIPVGHRKPRFRAMAQGMIDAGRPIYIFETGCLRKCDVPEAEGCSTLVWDYVAQRTEGGLISVDISPQNVAYAQSKVSNYTQVICKDSVLLLRSLTGMDHPIDLLYLDSLDYQGTLVQCALSALHHAAELSAAWPWLAPDALIAVDDCHGPHEGKGVMVRGFFHAIGVAPLVDDYIHVWRKPSLKSVSLPLAG